MVIPIPTLKPFIEPGKVIVHPATSSDTTQQSAVENAQAEIAAVQQLTVQKLFQKGYARSQIDMDTRFIDGILQRDFVFMKPPHSILPAQTIFEKTTATETLATDTYSIGLTDQTYTSGDNLFDRIVMAQEEGQAYYIQHDGDVVALSEEETRLLTSTDTRQAQAKADMFAQVDANTQRAVVFNITNTKD